MSVSMFSAALSPLACSASQDLLYVTCRTPVPSRRILPRTIKLKQEHGLASISQRQRYHCSWSCRAAVSEEAAENAVSEELLLKDYSVLTEKIEELSKSVAERLQGTSVYLVGMMGSGKSTTGKMLASSLQYCHFDSDSLIEQLAGKTVAQIFEEDGEEDFREVETQVLAELSPFTSLVVSTGGGVVTRSMNWSYMHQGVVVWLTGRAEVLAERVVHQGTESRPLLADDQQEGSTEDAFSSTVTRLTSLLDQRRDQYRMSDMAVSIEGVGADAARGAPTAVVVYRVLQALDRKMNEAKAEREERQKFTINDTSDLSNMKVVDAKKNNNNKGFGAPKEE